jgi:hypothetical protein
MAGWVLVYLIWGLMALAALAIVVALVAVPLTVALRRTRTPRPGPRRQ